MRIFLTMFYQKIILISYGAMEYYITQKNPYKAFEITVESLKNNGYVLVGLYNKIGRVRTLVRKYLSKIFGIKLLEFFDPTLKHLKLSEKA